MPYRNRTDSAELSESRARLREAARAQYSQDGEAVLLESNVAFLDLLGFSELMKNFDDIELRRLLVTMRNNVDFFEVWDAYEGPQRVVTFSDNVCACVPVDGEEVDGGLGWHIISSGQFQRNLTLNGYFVRGGITVGPVYADEGTIMGSALVKAYTLETEANYPRVVLDPEQVATFAFGVINEGHPHSALQNRCVLVDGNDGAVFVNYLDFLTEADDDDEFYDALQLHRDILGDRLREHARNPKVLAKYEWATRYHNWVCDTHFRLPQYRLDVPFASTPEPDAFIPLIQWLEKETDWDTDALKEQRFGGGAFQPVVPG